MPRKREKFTVVEKSGEFGVILDRRNRKLKDRAKRALQLHRSGASVPLKPPPSGTPHPMTGVEISPDEDKRKLIDRSTRGSPSFTNSEIALGFRKL